MRRIFRPIGNLITRSRRSLKQMLCDHRWDQRVLNNAWGPVVLKTCIRCTKQKVTEQAVAEVKR